MVSVLSGILIFTTHCSIASFRFLLLQSFAGLSTTVDQYFVSARLISFSDSRRYLGCYSPVGLSPVISQFFTYWPPRRFVCYSAEADASVSITVCNSLVWSPRIPFLKINRYRFWALTFQVFRFPVYSEEFLFHYFDLSESLSLFLSNLSYDVPRNTILQIPITGYVCNFWFSPSFYSEEYLVGYSDLSKASFPVSLGIVLPFSCEIFWTRTIFLLIFV